MPEETPGKDTAYTPRRDDIQRLALMIYSRERLTIYTASRDYGVKSVPLFRAPSFFSVRKSTVISSKVERSPNE